MITSADWKMCPRVIAERLDTLEGQLRQCVEQRDALEVENERLRAKLATARKGLQAVDALIAESSGVDGLHQNGDVAPWSELQTGGRFEEWLRDFDSALKREGGAMAELTRAIEYAKLAAVAGKGYAARHCHNLEGDFSQIIMHLDSALRALEQTNIPHSDPQVAVSASAETAEAVRTPARSEPDKITTCWHCGQRWIMKDYKPLFKE